MHLQAHPPVLGGATSAKRHWEDTAGTSPARPPAWEGTSVNITQNTSTSNVEYPGPCFNSAGTGQSQLSWVEPLIHRIIPKGI